MTASIRRVTYICAIGLGIIIGANWQTALLT